MKKGQCPLLHRFKWQLLHRSLKIEAEAQYKVERPHRSLCGKAVFRAPFRRVAFPSSFEWNGNNYQLSNLVMAPKPPVRC